MAHVLIIRVEFFDTSMLQAGLWVALISSGTNKLARSFLD